MGLQTLHCACLIAIFSYIAQMNEAAADRFPKQYIGCFKDSYYFHNRAMGAGDIMFAMTIGRCRSHCQNDHPSTFFGVRAADTCHCGEQFDRHGQVDDRSCSMRCSGDSGEVCGGQLTLRVYWVCPIGFYGSSCDSRCSLNCQNHTRLGFGCYLNGTCPAGCQDGWDGPRCDRNLGPMLVLKPPAAKSYSPRDGSFAWSCKVVNAATDVDYEIGWYSSNGTEITNTVAGSSNEYIEVESRSSKKLHVLQVFDWVSENYTCRENIAGRLKEKDVSMPFVQPFITKFDVTSLNTVGKRITFSCEAQGLPRPRYLFYQGVQTTTPLKSSNDIVVDDRSGRLIFHSVQMKDGGYYTCKAFNDFGYATRDTQIIVYAEPKPSGCLVNNGGCTHHCTDKDFGVRCSCKGGYRLRDDGRTCQVETVSVKTIGTIFVCIAGAVVLLIVIAVCKNRAHKNRQKSLQSTTSLPAVNMSSPPGRVDEASGFANRDDRPMSRDDETRADVMPEINPDFAAAERPTEVTGLIPSAPDVEPPSYGELFGGTRNKLDEE